MFENFESVPKIEKEINLILVEMEVQKQAWVVMNPTIHYLGVFGLEKIHNGLDVIIF
jgi:hypothetical protein